MSAASWKPAVSTSPRGASRANDVPFVQDSTAASQAVGGYVFYNRSALDGDNAAADAADAAIAADKQALLLPPGDGKIDAADLMIVRNNQRHTLSRFAPPPPTEGTAAAAPAASPVPVPAPSRRPPPRNVQ